MTLSFTKMHSLSNDFIVINSMQQPFFSEIEVLQCLADRHRGIGFDQCLVVEAPRQAGFDFFYRIFNADGSEVGQCANGARCLAAFIHYYGLTDKRQFRLQTATTSIEAFLEEDGQVRLMLPPPRLQPSEIPLAQGIEQADLYSIPLFSQQFQVHALSVGNPHAVLKVDALEGIEFEKLGRALSEHPFFPAQANVSFMQLINEKELALRVYERGVGETQACGSAALASAAVARLYYQTEARMSVHLPGGQLLVEWESIHEPLSLIGPVAFVYEGTLLSSLRCT